MATTRQDAWTDDEDLLLAEVVLRHIREGGTQLSAFKEVGRHLSRTPADVALDGILTLESNTKNVLKKRSNCVKWKIMK